MIVTESADHYRLISQNGHSRQVRRLASLWQRPIPNPGPASIDDYRRREPCQRLGAYDLQPDPVDGAAEDILDPPPEAWNTSSERAVNRTTDIERYSGLLVSMYDSRVRRQRLGIDPSLPDVSNGFAQFIADQEDRGVGLMAELAGETGSASTPPATNGGS